MKVWVIFIVTCIVVASSEETKQPQDTKAVEAPEDVKTIEDVKTVKATKVVKNAEDAQTPEDIKAAKDVKAEKIEVAKASSDNEKDEETEADVNNDAIINHDKNDPSYTHGVFNCYTREMWSKKKRNWCCKHKKLGCHGFRVKVKHDEANDEETEVKVNNNANDPKHSVFYCYTKEMWTKKKRSWCCKHFKIGCHGYRIKIKHDNANDEETEVKVSNDANDPRHSVFNCYTREMWSKKKRNWCCKHKKLGCHGYRIKVKHDNANDEETEVKVSNDANDPRHSEGNQDEIENNDEKKDPKPWGRRRRRCGGRRRRFFFGRRRCGRRRRRFFGDATKE